MATVTLTPASQKLNTYSTMSTSECLDQHYSDQSENENIHRGTEKEECRGSSPSDDEYSTEPQTKETDSNNSQTDTTEPQTKETDSNNSQTDTTEPQTKETDSNNSQTDTTEPQTKETDSNNSQTDTTEPQTKETDSNNSQTDTTEPQTKETDSNNLQTDTTEPQTKETDSNNSQTDTTEPQTKETDSNNSQTDTTEPQTKETDSNNSQTDTTEPQTKETDSNNLQTDTTEPQTKETDSNNSQTDTTEPQTKETDSNNSQTDTTEPQTKETDSNNSQTDTTEPQTKETDSNNSQTDTTEPQTKETDSNNSQTDTTEPQTKETDSNNSQTDTDIPKLDKSQIESHSQPGNSTKDAETSQKEPDEPQKAASEAQQNVEAQNDDEPHKLNEPQEKDEPQKDDDKPEMPQKADENDDKTDDDREVSQETVKESEEKLVEQLERLNVSDEVAENEKDKVSTDSEQSNADVNQTPDAGDQLAEDLEKLHVSNKATEHECSSDDKVSASGDDVNSALPEGHFSRVVEFDGRSPHGGSVSQTDYSQGAPLQLAEQHNWQWDKEFPQHDPGTIVIDLPVPILPNTQPLHHYKRGLEGCCGQPVKYLNVNTNAPAVTEGNIRQPDQHDELSGLGHTFFMANNAQGLTGGMLQQTPINFSVDFGMATVGEVPARSNQFEMEILRLHDILPEMNAPVTQFSSDAMGPEMSTFQGVNSAMPQVFESADRQMLSAKRRHTTSPRQQTFTPPRPTQSSSSGPEFNWCGDMLPTVTGLNTVTPGPQLQNPPALTQQYPGPQPHQFPPSEPLNTFAGLPPMPTLDAVVSTFAPTFNAMSPPMTPTPLYPNNELVGGPVHWDPTPSIDDLDEVVSILTSPPGSTSPQYSHSPQSTLQDCASPHSSTYGIPSPHSSLYGIPSPHSTYGVSSPHPSDQALFSPASVFSSSGSDSVFPSPQPHSDDQVSPGYLVPSPENDMELSEFLDTLDKIGCVRHGSTEVDWDDMNNIIEKDHPGLPSETDIKMERILAELPRIEPAPRLPMGAPGMAPNGAPARQSAPVRPALGTAVGTTVGTTVGITSGAAVAAAMRTTTMGASGVRPVTMSAVAPAIAPVMAHMRAPAPVRAAQVAPTGINRTDNICVVEKPTTKPSAPTSQLSHGNGHKSGGVALLNQDTPDREEELKALSYVSSLTIEQISRVDEDKDTMIHIVVDLNDSKKLYLLKALCTRLKREGLLEKFINAPNTSCRTPLYAALLCEPMEGHPNMRHELLQQLLDFGADVNVSCCHGRTNGGLETIYQSPLHLAASLCAADDVQILLLKDDSGVNSQNTAQETPLHCAVRKHKSDLRNKIRDCCNTVKVLVDHGADIGAKAKAGKTVLHTIADNKWDANLLEFVLKQIPLDRQPTVLNTKDDSSNTVLHLLLGWTARLNGTRTLDMLKRMLVLFLQYGANPKCKDARHRTSQQFVRDNDELMQLLHKHKERRPSRPKVVQRQAPVHIAPHPTPYIPISMVTPQSYYQPPW